ncbi:hypothetical protein FCK90_05805 [Kocuria coralli]|uniref:Uncharacterized protein n=1 Tax=Kocuria coralli TaxID=1461025 RepID=A0A5J5KYS7_9MICC|nr:DUF6350 family protein [Kocuria coralli]KAA9394682.1 hypothetical protein FCK90_05805 [Kocuria coralli]
MSWTKGLVPGVTIALVALAAVEIVVLLSVMAGGFAELSSATGLVLGMQLWLLSLGVPLGVSVAPVTGAAAVQGTVSLIPLGLSLLTAALGFVMGRNLARRAPSGAGLAAAVLTTAVTHALVAAGAAFLTASGSVHATPGRALLVGGLIVLAATAAGALRGGGTPAALLGTWVVERARKTGQDMRWTGSFLWAVLRAAVVATVAALFVGAVIVTAALVLGWQQVVAIQQQLGSDAAGDTVFAILHFALLPNFLVWAVSWASGAGFYLGDGALVSPAGTQVETVPLLPLFGALPPQDASPVLAAAPGLLVLCGVLAGWWFVREGENHLGEWISIRIPWRPVAAPVVVVVSGAIIGAVSALLVAVLAAAASGSLGVGRMDLVGPQVWETALVVGLEIAIGAAIGAAVGPWVEHGRAVRTYHPGEDAAAMSGPGAPASPGRQDRSEAGGPAAERGAFPAEAGPGSGPASGAEETASAGTASTGTASTDAGSAGERHGRDRVRPDAQGGTSEEAGGLFRRGRDAAGASRTSRGARERDREAERRREIADKHRQRAHNADLKAQKRYAAAEKRRARRKAARDR